MDASVNKFFGHLRVSYYETCQSTKITSSTSNDDLPYFMLDATCIRRPRADGNANLLKEPNVLSSKTYMALPYMFVQTSNITKLKSLLLCSASQSTRDSWCQCDLVLSTTKSTTPFSASLCTALRTAAEAMELIIFTGKVPAPNRDPQYCNQVFIDGALLARLDPAFPCFDVLLANRREQGAPYLQRTLSVPYYSSNTTNVPSPNNSESVEKLPSPQELADRWQSALSQSCGLPQFASATPTTYVDVPLSLIHISEPTRRS